MNFFAVILILKMEEDKKYIFIVLCFIISRKVNTQSKCKKRFVQCGGGAVIDRACQKWFAKFLGTIDVLAK